MGEEEEGSKNDPKVGGRQQHHEAPVEYSRGDVHSSSAYGGLELKKEVRVETET